MKLIHLTEAAIGTLLVGEGETLPPEAGGCALALGSFDGLHLGHRRLIEAVCAARTRLALPAAALFTFRHHPRQLLDPDNAPPLLTPWREKLALLRDTGIDLLVAADFCPALANTPYDLFVRRFLVGRLGLRHFVAGHDMHLGAGRGGSAATLERLGASLGYGFEEVPALEVAGRLVSSSTIRALLLAGDVTGARGLLGRAYASWGEVGAGEGRGRTIGFPTANVTPLEPRKLLPAPGVYAAHVLVPEDVAATGAAWDAAPPLQECPLPPANGFGCDDPRPGRYRRLPAMLNHGHVPTFHPGGLAQPRLEAHLLDFHGELGGRAVRIEWVARLRSERKFQNANDLSAQLRADARATLDALRA